MSPESTLQRREARHGESSIDWGQWKPGLRATLLFVLRPEDRRVLLIHKKRGMGSGKVNGPGGKLDEGEAEEAGARREVEEEVCIQPRDVEASGRLHFAFRDGLNLECSVFRAQAFEGEPTETDEAAPFWCDYHEVPYDKMWEDDRYWLPGMLAGGRFEAWFEFDGETMLWHRVRWLASGARAQP